jgi:pyruvate formate lyase activating enzyme
MIRVGGMTPLTTIDFPGRLSAVLYLQGCPWRCGYCHNPELLPARGRHVVAWARIEAFLHRRRGLLDGVVFSGGEPTSQAALVDAVERVKAMGYEVGLHTGGMYPARLRQVLPLLDWVGLDIKADDETYDGITGRRGSARPVHDSLDAVLRSGVGYECRTTWHSETFPVSALYRLAENLARRGVAHWVVQARRGAAAPSEIADRSRLARPFESFEWRDG